MIGISEISRSGAIRGSWPRTVEKRLQLVYLQFASTWGGGKWRGQNGLTPGIVSDEGSHIKTRHYDEGKKDVQEKVRRERLNLVFISGGQWGL